MAIPLQCSGRFAMSGRRFLLDTNVVIGLLKADPAAIALQRELGFDLPTSAVSQITRMELLGFPGLLADEESAIRALLDACEVVAISDAVETEAIAIRKSLGVRLPDAIIAASAHAAGLVLVTLDLSLAKALARMPS